MKKDNKTLLRILTIIIGILILYNYNPDLFIIFKSKTISPVLDQYINKFYFPAYNVGISFRWENNTWVYDNGYNDAYPMKCTNSNIVIGTSFSLSTNNLPPVSRSCLFAEKQSYSSIKAYSNIAGKCSSFGGKVITLSGTPIFTKSNIFLIKNGEEYIVCKESGKTYSYTVFQKSSQLCQVKYSPFTIYPEAAYECRKDGNIYEIPCGGTANNPKKAKLIQKCELGCNAENMRFEPYGKTDVVKCNGAYKPNVKVCDSDKTALYTTDAAGKLTINNCCGCTNNKCNPCPMNLTSPRSDCYLASGGNNKINIFFYNPRYMPSYGQWVLNQMKTEAPFYEFTYNLYIEQSLGACESVVPSRQKDFRIGFDNLGEGFYGYSVMPGPNLNSPWKEQINLYKSGYVILNTNELDRFMGWHFVLFHELGHIYTRSEHTNDGSIMDQDGGDQKFKKYQIDIIRKNLEVTT